MKLARQMAWSFLIIVLVIDLWPPLVTYSQEQNTSVTLLVPTWMHDTLPPSVFEPLEAAHPGGRVELARDPGINGFFQMPMAPKTTGQPYNSMSARRMWFSPQLISLF